MWKKCVRVRGFETRNTALTKIQPVKSRQKLYTYITKCMNYNTQNKSNLECNKQRQSLNVSENKYLHFFIMFLSIYILYTRKTNFN